MTQRQAKRGTKKLKDLDPKGKAKKVTGGRSNLGVHTRNIRKHVGNVVEVAGDTIDNRLNPGP
jgi:hypothetical protein